MKLRKVEVEWEDACTMGGWNQMEVFAEAGLLPVTTTGYLLKKDNKSVVVVQNVSAEGKCSDSITIPRSSIKKVRYLK